MRIHNRLKASFWYYFGVYHLRNLRSLKLPRCMWDGHFFGLELLEVYTRLINQSQLAKEVM